MKNDGVQLLIVSLLIFGSHYSVAAESSKTLLKQAFKNARPVVRRQSLLEKEIQREQGPEGKDLFKQVMELMHKLDPWAVCDYCDGVIVIYHKKTLTTVAVAHALSTPYKECVLVTSYKSTPGETILEFMSIKPWRITKSASGLDYKEFIAY